MPRYIAQFTLGYTGTLELEAGKNDEVPKIDVVRARIARELKLDDQPEGYTLGSTNTQVQLQQVPTEEELEAQRVAGMQNAMRNRPSPLLVPR